MYRVAKNLVDHATMRADDGLPSCGANLKVIEVMSRHPSTILNRTPPCHRACRLRWLALWLATIRRGGRG
jgi:hypothetical protein